MAAELSVGAYVKVVGGTGGLNGELGTIKRIDSRRFQVELKKEGKTIWREAAQLEKQPEPKVVRPRAGSVKDLAQKLDKVEIGNKTPAERPLSRGGSQGCAGSNDRPAAPAETPEEEPRPLGEAGRTGSVLDRAKAWGKAEAPAADVPP